MWKIIVGVVALIIVVAVGAWLIFGNGKGIGTGSGDGKGDGNTKVVNDQTESSNEENDIIEDEEKEITEEENEYAEDLFDGAIIKVNVVGNDYFYDNERKEVDDIVSLVETIDGDVVVEIFDDNASLRAYNGLIERLEEEHISYVEK